MSAWWSGLRRSARIPPWTFGWSVTTRWPRMAGKPVSSATSVTARPASRSALAVPPLEMRSQPEPAELAGELDDAGLVVDGEQGPHRRGHFASWRRVGSARTARMVSG